jgi:sigma-B regulation protein RsbU (phosphoserine phosphatase)
MFITLFCGLVNLRTGECRHASGGHDPRSCCGAREPSRTPPKGRAPCSAWPRTTFETATLELAPGDTLFACTDGVGEAEDGHDGFYGKDRTIAQLASLAGRSAADIVQAMRSDVRAFAGAAPPVGRHHAVSAQVPG